MSIGISIDGPEDWHDRFRVNHTGRGSYRKVRRAIELLAADSRKLAWGTLTVANPDFPGTRVFSHLVDLGVRNMDFLWPDYHHDMRPPWPTGALSQYYTELFDAWLDAMNPDIKVRWFTTVIEMLLGATPGSTPSGRSPSPRWSWRRTAAWSPWTCSASAGMA